MVPLGDERLNRPAREVPEGGLPVAGPRRLLPVLLRRSAAVVLVSVVCLGVLSAAVRILRLVPDNVPVPHVQVAGDESFAPRPNASATSMFGVHFRSDSHGLRGPERAISTDPDTLRVALVGDSVVWGWGIEEQETISSWLERLAAGRGLCMETRNLGVQAHNIFNERARFERLVGVLRPRVTVVVLLFNDLHDGPVRLRVTPSGHLAGPGRRAPFPDSWRPWLEQSPVYQAAIRIYGAVWNRGREQNPLQHMPTLLTQLDRIRVTAAKNGSALVVAAMPGLWPEPQRFERFSRSLAAYCEPRDIPFVDLTAALGKAPDRRFYLPSDSIHPSGEGARRVAETLLPLVSRSGEEGR